MRNRTGVFLAAMIGSPMLSAASPVVIVALGDSTTAGTPFFSSPAEVPPEGRGNEKAPYTYWLGQGHPSWKVMNRGVNGERSDEVSARFESDVLAVHPRLVIIFAGVNDTYSGVPVEKTEENLRLMYRRALAAGIFPVAATILPFDRADPASAAKIDVINAWIREEAHTLKIALCDFNAIAAKPAHPHELRGSPDGLHPDLATYRRMGEHAGKILSALLDDK
jgi:lysophospholipase L1-like esterase